MNMHSVSGQAAAKPQRAAKRAAKRQGASVRGVNYASNPVMTSPAPRWRSRLIVGLTGLAFAALAAAAFEIQVLHPGFYQEKGAERYADTVTLPASRGKVLDRHGVPLAESVQAPTLVANTRFYKPNSAEASALAKRIGMRTADLQARLQKGGAYLVLKRQVDGGVAQRIKDDNIKGLFFEPGYVRVYPESEAAAHVVGLTNWSDKGQEGIELALHRQLEGRNGKRTVIVDRMGRVLEDVSDPLPPQDGGDVQLTIDARLQALAYGQLRDAVREHRAKAGGVVVLDAQSGEILALANYPSYKPEERKAVSSEQLRNRAITDVFEPGSTVKPFIVAKALDKGLVSPGMVFDTAPFRVGPLTVNDGSHGRPQMSVAQIIQKSSNVGSVKIASKLSAQEMGEMYSALGFGSKPQIGFPGAATGRLRSWKSWKPVEKATMAYGYGLNASLLQIARAYTALARQGDVAPVTLVRGAPVGAPVQVFSPQTAKTMREMMRGTVSKDGTAPLAQPIGYSAGGKTGTAEKLENGSYRSDKHRAWFAGMSPIDDPRVIIAVMIDEPQGVYFGGLVAAPVFKTVAEQALQTLGVQPDLPIEPQVYADAPTAGAVAARAAPAAPNKTAKSGGAAGKAVGANAWR